MVDRGTWRSAWTCMVHGHQDVCVGHGAAAGIAVCCCSCCWHAVMYAQGWPGRSFPFSCMGPAPWLSAKGLCCVPVLQVLLMLWAGHLQGLTIDMTISTDAPMHTCAAC